MTRDWTVSAPVFVRPRQLSFPSVSFRSVFMLSYRRIFSVATIVLMPVVASLALVPSQAEPSIGNTQPTSVISAASMHDESQPLAAATPDQTADRIAFLGTTNNNVALQPTDNPMDPQAAEQPTMASVEQKEQGKK